MTPETQTIIDRIELLRRVATEHERIEFRSVPNGAAMDADNKVFSTSFEKNERLMRMSATCDAARRELEETYRTLRVTEDMPSSIVASVVDIRMRDAGDEAWCRRIHALGGQHIRYEWLRGHHLGVVARGGEIDAYVRQALMLEDASTDLAA